MVDLIVVEKEIQGMLGEESFMSYYGMRLHALGEGECTVEVPYRAIFVRPGGVVNGPVFMAAADAVMWFAIMTVLPLEESRHSVTAELKTNFLSGAREEAFLATARILKLGRRLIYGVIECRNRQGKLLTHHTATYIRPGSGA